MILLKTKYLADNWLAEWVRFYFKWAACEFGLEFLISVRNMGGKW